MSLQMLTRVAAAAALTVSIGAFVAADIKGDYNLEFVVQEAPYAGTLKTTAGAKGAFTGKLDFTSPSKVLSDVTGKSVGDSVTFEGKYEDQGRGCTGTLVARGTAEKDGSKASGVVDINDSCGGALAGTFRMWK